MRQIGLLILTLALAQVAPAQTGTTYGSRGGFGNVLYPGTGHAPNDPSFAQRLGSNIAGRPYGAPRVNHSHGNGAVIVPYPVIVGGYGGYGYYDGPPQQQQQQNAPQVFITNPAPSVVINQTFLQDRAPVAVDQQPEPEQRTGMRVYEGLKTVPQTPRSDKPTLYLIAFKDHRIVPALGYWLEGENLHYVTADHTLNQASLDLIDRPMSQQLNDERSVEFKLPADR